MAFAALPLALAGTAIEGLSQFQQSMYQSHVAKDNAKIAGENASRTDYASQVEQLRSDREYRAEGSALLATQAASGLDVLGRSQIMARSNVARVRSEAALDIRKQGYYDVRNLQQEQANYLGEARAAKTQAWMGLAATAFSMGSSVAKSPQGRKGVNSLIGGAKSTLGA